MAIPSRKWFPQNLQERAAWYANFNTQIQIIGASLGLTAADLTAIGSDNNVIQFLASTATELDAYAEAVRQYRIVITEHGIGDPTPAFPADAVFALPNVIPTGAFERLDDLVKRIRVAPAYTPETGALLGILTTTATPPPESELKPVIKASESFGGYTFSVNVTRMGMDAFKVQIQRKDSSTWQDAAFATNNPAEITVTPTTPGNPERIYVRAILMKKNAPVGQPSDPTYVTINP